MKQNLAWHQFKVSSLGCLEQNEKSVQDVEVHLTVTSPLKKIPQVAFIRLYSIPLWWILITNLQVTENNKAMDLRIFSQVWYSKKKRLRDLSSKHQDSHLDSHPWWTPSTMSWRSSWAQMNHRKNAWIGASKSSWNIDKLSFESPWGVKKHRNFECYFHVWNGSKMKSLPKPMKLHGFLYFFRPKKFKKKTSARCHASHALDEGE